MIEIIFAVAVIIILFAGCAFVNKSKTKHGACCGKGCRSCKVFEENRKK